MRTSIELPDPLFRELKTLAARRGTTMKAIIQQSVEKELSGQASKGYRVELPLIRSNSRRKLKLTNAEIENIFALEDYRP